MNDKLSSILNKVNALLNRAEHPNTPAPEAEASRRKAEELMLKYRIEEEEVRQTKLATNAADAIKPIKHEVVLCAWQSEYKQHYLSLFGAIADHVGNLRWAYKYNDGQTVVTLVGFESDVRYAETLYTALRLHFANTLEPTVDPSLSDAENVYRLRAAGIERIRIAQMMWGDGSHANNAKVTKLYKAACVARGEDPKVVGRSLDVKTYRASFADSYTSRIWDRLWSMRAATREAGGSGGLVLAGRKEAVNAFYYELFPHLKPSDAPALPEGTTGGPYGNCPKCKKAQSGYCREHSYLKPRKQDRKVSYVGLSAGRSAADSADLGDQPKGNKVESPNRNAIES